MADQSAMNAWVTRVLGVTYPGAASNVTGSDEDVLGLWRDAKEDVDSSINRLADKMRATGHPDLIRIADFGLFGIVNGEGANVGLTKALFQYRAATGERRMAAADGVRKAVATYRKALSTSRAAALIDSNPFGVPVSLSTTLGRALDRIERAVG